MTYDDLPIIRIPPAPNDAELQAERDTTHAALIAQELTDGEWDDYLTPPKEI